MIIVNQNNGIMHYQDHGNHENRGISMMSLFHSTVTRFNIRKNFELTIHTEDRSFGKYSFSTITKNYNETIPDFLYDRWKEIGVYDYQYLIDNFENTIPETNKIGWIGGICGSNVRQNFVNLAPNYSNQIETASNNWVKREDGILHVLTPGFMTYQQQINKWKYLIDMEGHGWSARLKVLLSSPRIVFMVERPYEEWFFEYLEPWTHYVPVKRDLSDLLINYDIIEKDIKLQEHIKLNANAFKKLYLTRAAAENRIKDIINSL